MTDKNNLWIYRSDILNPSRVARVKLKTVIRYLNRKNRVDANAELDATKQQLAELQAQMAELIASQKRRGRPPKELTEG